MSNGLQDIRMPGKLKTFLKLGILPAVVCFLILMPGYLKVRSLKKEILHIKENIERLQKENENLRIEIDKLENDPFTIEKKARERLGMIKEGEVKFRFVSPDTGTVEQSKKSKQSKQSRQ